MPITSVRLLRLRQQRRVRLAITSITKAAINKDEERRRSERKKGNKKGGRRGGKGDEFDEYEDEF